VEQYDADYYLRGKETGKSLYENYRWMPELTIPMAKAIVDHCKITMGGIVFDFGCARGYLVKALRRLGYCAYGYDTSEWATDNADPAIYHHLTRLPEIAFRQSYEWVIAKDVLEHVSQVTDTINQLMEIAERGLFVVVPLAATEGSKNYVVPDYDKDVTHIHRFTLPEWARMFMRPGWSHEASYRVKGVKDNYSQYKNGNGFITCRRLDS
jgi:Methyltransferase domain